MLTSNENTGICVPLIHFLPVQKAAIVIKQVFQVLLSLPNIISAPLKESQTIYDAFAEKPEKGERAAKEQQKTHNGETQPQQKKQAHPKKKQTEKKDKPSNLEEAASKVCIKGKHIGL